jgi:subtilase family serine protease
MKLRTGIPIAMVAALVLATLGGAATSTSVTLQGNVSPLLAGATDLGPAPGANVINVVWSLQLRNTADLDQFLADVQNPASTIYHQFLTQDQFNERFAPTPAQEQAVVAYLQSQGFTVTQTFSNHLLVEATAPIAVVEKAFSVQIDAVLYDGTIGFAALNEPSVPADLAAFTTGISGLDNLGRVQPMHSLPTPVASPSPNDNLGSNCCYFSPRDLNVAYNEDHLGSHTGSGQTGVIVGAYDFQTSDFSAFNTQMGLSNPTVTKVCAGSGAGCAYDASNSIEISLDIEYLHGTVPSANLVSIMAQTTLLTDFQTAYNLVVTRHDGNAVSTSWGLCEKSMSSTQRSADDAIFANGNAIGQTWFSASGDSGSKDCNHLTGVDYPASSPYVLGVGGTHLNCSGGMTVSQPVCTGYGSESGWSGSGGGNSVYYSKPSWQTGCGVTGTVRMVPDVSLEADTSPGNLVAKGGGWYAVGGTSDAAPQLAGMFVALNAAKGAQGNGGARLYQLCGGTSFHDVTSGSNGGFSAVSGYDRVTGVGTPNEGNLITNW